MPHRGNERTDRPTRSTAPRLVAAAAAIVLAACSSMPAPADDPLEPALGTIDVLPRPGGTVRPERVRTYEGAVAARAAVPAGSGNKFARTVVGGASGGPRALDYAEGDELWFGLAVYLPAGFHDAVASYFSPLRWDNFGTRAVSRSGLAMYEDGRLRLFRERDGVEEQVNLLADVTVALDEERWYWLEVHQRLSSNDGQALNELFVDGREVGSSTMRNYYGEPMTAVRYGIVALSASEQTAPLELAYDRPTLGSRQVGPREAA